MRSISARTSRSTIVGKFSYFWTATAVAIAVVAVELTAISYIRHRFMDTPFLQATFQVVVGGVLVFVAGILIGSS